MQIHKYNLELTLIDHENIEQYYKNAINALEEGVENSKDFKIKADYHEMIALVKTMGLIITNDETKRNKIRLSVEESYNKAIMCIHKEIQKSNAQDNANLHESIIDICTNAINFIRYAKDCENLTEKQLNSMKKIMQISAQTAKQESPDEGIDELSLKQINPNYNPKTISGNSDGSSSYSSKDKESIGWVSWIVNGIKKVAMTPINVIKLMLSFVF